MRRDATARPGGDDPAFYANEFAYLVRSPTAERKKTESLATFDRTKRIPPGDSR